MQVFTYHEKPDSSEIAVVPLLPNMKAVLTQEHAASYELKAWDNTEQINTERYNHVAHYYHPHQVNVTVRATIEISGTIYL